VSALVRITARQQSQIAVTVRCLTRVTVEARGSHSTQITLYVFVAPPATHGLDSGRGAAACKARARKADASAARAGPSRRGRGSGAGRSVRAAA